MLLLPAVRALLGPLLLGGRLAPLAGGSTTLGAAE